MKRSLTMTGVLVLTGALLAACAFAPVGVSTSGTAESSAVAAAETSTASVESLGSEVSTTSVESTTAAVAETSSTFVSDDGVARPAGWVDATHSNDVDPDYAAAYPQDAVTELRITIDPEQWQIMRDDITDILGELSEDGGFGGVGGPPMGGGFIFTDTLPISGTFPFSGTMPGGMGRPEGMDGPGFGGDLVSETPTWVEATIEHEGNVWTHVGIRYKGNSSLRGSWNGDGLKLPFKLDFDEWEDDYPEIDNQRFYGFKELSLANNFSDDTGMRDSLAYDALEAAGLPAGETTFYNVILNYGEGDIDLGLYTSNEVVDATVIAGYFGSDDGNIYEADGRAASLAEGVRESIPDAFEKKNNEDAADWSDIEGLYDVLHSDRRTTDPEAWQAELESIFNVDQFLNWLAVASVINHWDTYGQMTHNFYLYDDPDTGLLNWISWDHNMTFGSGGGGMGRTFRARADAGMGAGAPFTGTAPLSDVVMLPPGGGQTGMGGPGGGQDFGPGGRGGMGGQSATSTENLARTDTSEQWPLIAYLLETPAYRAVYDGYVAQTLEQGFVEEELLAKVDEWAELLQPYADAENGDTTSFAAAIESLKQFISERAATVQTYVDGQ